jgi:hypothetical protein
MADADSRLRTASTFLFGLALDLAVGAVTLAIVAGSEYMRRRGARS